MSSGDRAAALAVYRDEGEEEGDEEAGEVRPEHRLVHGGPFGPLYHRVERLCLLLDLCGAE